jgi:hypothetical protein
MLMGNLLELLKQLGPGNLSPTAAVLQLATAVPRGFPTPPPDVRAAFDHLADGGESVVSA